MQSIIEDAYEYGKEDVLIDFEQKIRVNVAVDSPSTSAAFEAELGDDLLLAYI